MQALLRQLDFHPAELAAMTSELATEVALLMTIPSVEGFTAISVVAAVGDFTRFDRPRQARLLHGLSKVR